MEADVVPNSTVVMLEEAPVAIGAETFGKELLALLRLVFIILGVLVDEFVLTMGELTFRPVSAYSVFDPVLAHLSFEFLGVQLLSCLAHIGKFLSSKSFFLQLGQNHLLVLWVTCGFPGVIILKLLMILVVSLVIAVVGILEALLEVLVLGWKEGLGILKLVKFV